MLTRKLIHRLSFTVAVSVSVSNATNAFAFQEYQPGEPGKSATPVKSSVTQELNRMFQESGQPMPSMNAADLPNANVPIQGQVKLREGQSQSVYPPPAPATIPGQPQVEIRKLNHAQPQHQNLVQTKQANPSEKQSFMGRLFGKLRGDTVPKDPNYKPPVPPDFNPNATKTSQNQAQAITGQPNNKTRQISNHSPIGATNETPPRSSVKVHAATNTHEVNSTSSSSGPRTEYTQPGSAPGFMSTAGTPSVIPKQPAADALTADEFDSVPQGENSTATGSRDSSLNGVQNLIPPSASRSDNNVEFDSPFQEMSDSNTESDLLDLDSLIDIPPGDDRSEPVMSLETPQQTPSFDEATPVENSQEIDRNESSIGPDENPFTGVQLNESDAEFFSEEELATDSELQPVPAAPMEEFQPDLPAIKIPPSSPPEIALPAVEDEDLFTPLESSENNTAQRPAINQTVPTPSDAGQQAKSKSVPDVPAAMSAAETEQLKQTAEREARQQQLRLIQSRVGRTGFKGFCPVELREHRELVDASDRFTSTFGLQTYTFSSAAAKSAFDVEPSRFAAAAGGSDVVVLVNSGEEQPGLLDYALWYRDRLYFFRSRETMTLFSKDPQRFASQY